MHAVVGAATTARPRTRCTARCATAASPVDVVHPSADLTAYRAGRRAHPLPRLRRARGGRRARPPRPAATCSSPTSPASSTSTTTSGSAATPARSVSCSASGSRSSSRCGRARPCRSPTAPAAMVERGRHALADTEVVTTYAGGPLAGRPAVTRAPSAAGAAWYLGTLPDDAPLGALSTACWPRPACEPRSRPAERGGGRRRRCRGELVALRAQPHRRARRGRRATGARPRLRTVAVGRDRPARARRRGRRAGRSERARQPTSLVILDRASRRPARSGSSELVERLGVSDMTIRRDIERLASDGLRRAGPRRRPRAGGAHSTDEPGFSAKSLLQHGREAGHRPGGRRPGRARQRHRDLRRHDHLRAGARCARRAAADRRDQLGARRPAAARVRRRRPDRGRSTGGVRTPSDALVGPVAVAALQLAARRPALPRRPRHRPQRRPDHAEPRRGRDQPGAGRASRAVVRRSPTTRRWASSGSPRSCTLGEVDTLVTDAGLPARARAILERSSTTSSSRTSGALVLADAARRGAGRDDARRIAPHVRGSPTAGRSSTSTTPPALRPRTVSDTRDLGARAPPGTSASTRSSATGSPSPGTGRTAPSCRPATSARSARPATGRCRPRSRTRLRRRGLREPLPVLLHRRDAPTHRTCRRSGTRPALGPLRGGLLHERPRRHASPRCPPRARAHGHRRLGRPHRARSPRSPGGRAGLLLREPRRRRSGSPCTTRTARSTPTRTCPPAPRSCSRGRRAPRAHRSPARCRHPRRRAGRRLPGRRSRPRTGRPTCPFAARWPVEVHLAPHRDVPDLVALDDDERDELADVYLDLLARLDRYYRATHGSPVRAALHRRLAPGPGARPDGRSPGCTCSSSSVLRAPGTLKYLAGSESGSAAGSTTPGPRRSPPGCAPQG